MSRTPCNAAADHQGATDPWLKTPGVQDSLKSLKLMLNESKTKFMIFSNGRNNVPPGHRICTRSGTNIEQVPCYKYLGIWLDDRLSFKSHVLDLAKKVKIKLGALYRIRSCFTFENRMEIVQSTIFIS